jgi:hypothetical protein
MEPILNILHASGPGVALLSAATQISFELDRITIEVATACGSINPEIASNAVIKHLKIEFTGLRRQVNMGAGMSTLQTRLSLT